ncbi:hypothetical protein FHS86_001909 [Roseimarinus sediminis]
MINDFVCVIKLRRFFNEHFVLKDLCVDQHGSKSINCWIGSKLFSKSEVLKNVYNEYKAR